MSSISIIDGTYTICRAVYSGGKMIDPTGNESGPCFKFLRMLWNYKDLGLPIIVFDDERSDFRKQIFPGYKERKESEDPEEIEAKQRARNSIDHTEMLLIKMLRFMGIPTVKMAGQEGDDLLYHIGLHYKEQGENVYCISDDGDFGQLVQYGINIYQPMKDEHINEKNFKEIHGFDPKYFCLWKACVGDDSDCINGVMGIGKKRAKELMAEMETLKLSPTAIALREMCKNTTSKSKFYKKVVEQFSIVKRNLLLMDISQAPLKREDVVNALQHSMSYTSYDPMRLMQYFKAYNFNQLGNWLSHTHLNKGQDVRHRFSKTSS